MITPADIQYKEFTRAKKGYKENEVDDFLDLIMADMEKLIRENKKLKEDLEKAKGQFDKHVTTTTSIYETLEAAKSLMNDIAASAERRAEGLLKNAELEAALITKDAKESVYRLTEEGNRLRERVETLKSRYKRMLEDELERMNFGGDNLLEEFEKEFLPASMASAFPPSSSEVPHKVQITSATTVMAPLDSKRAVREVVNQSDLSKTITNLK